MEECVLGTEQRRRLAAVKVARINLRKEEYVKGIGQKGYEYSKDVLTSVLSHAAGGSQESAVKASSILPLRSITMKISLVRFFLLYLDLDLAA
eukprot:scaffold2425_cov76-Skeletonema_dohrnii-CCMP3373.AAC.3